VTLPDRLDTLDMFGLTAGLPEQVAASVGLAADLDDLPDHDDIENVVVLGMGGSGIAGDVVREVAGPFMAVPVVVHKGYGTPNFIDEHSLVFAVSFSGNTEETLDAVTNAAMQGGRVVALSSGGELAELAGEWGAPHVALPTDIPMPRAGIGAVAIPPLMVLEQVGLFPGARSWVHAAVDQLTKRRDQLVADANPARHLAGRLGRQIPIIYGGGGLGLAAAIRWKCQINENAKAPAFYNVHPELCHNEICGWGQHGDLTRQVFQVVNLRHEYEHPQLARRYDLVNDLIAEVVADVHEVVAEGDGPLAQLFDLILFGDFVSLHLAYDAGVDPGPIPVLDDIKLALAE
jgi:glucose/mannose-6-phosphate isomerase